jgi:integrase/recombinase XerD
MSASFPSVRLVLHARPLKDGTFSVALRVTFRRKSKFFFLNRNCSRSDWDEKSGRFERSFPEYRRENDVLRTYEQRAADAIRAMERDGVPFTFERLQAAVFSADQVGGATSVVSFLREIRDDLRALGRFGNSNFYQSTANAVFGFRPRAVLADLDASWLSKFERWIDVSRDTNDGGKSIYLRTLRAMCNRAISDKLCPRSWYPFEGYSLAHLKTRKAKKSAGLDFIRALEVFVPADDRERLACDLFLFSFYCRGMNLADIADLTGANLQGGRLVYVRKKTGRSYSLPVNDRVSALVDRYAGGVRLFPVYLDQVTDRQKHYRRNKVSTQINRALRVIAERLGFDIPDLSFYTARHTYADSLKKAGVSVSVISEALGHSDVRVTDAYLKGFGDSVLDEADMLLG